jgi:D-glycero-alpha-D-manno-heptose-7-phosphate kinase
LTLVKKVASSLERWLYSNKERKLMLITKTPFRVSFCGGGSDLPSFYAQHGGCALSASINKYVYISIHPYFHSHQTVLKYSQTEIVDDLKDIEHKIIHRVLNDLGVEGVEITSTADIPAGTGLGSSSAFTVGLLHTLACYAGKYYSKARLAEKACEIEIERLGNPIGKQDQYAAALGGLNFIRFNQDGGVSHAPVMARAEVSLALQKNLIMFYLGETRSANTILREQNKNMADKEKTDNLLRMCDLAERMRAALESGDLSAFGRMLGEGWRLKRSLASAISNPEIDAVYERGLRAGAAGGKLLGAGGGGFLLFYCESERQEGLRRALGLRPTPFAFERDGTSVVYIGDKYWQD